MFSKVLIANRGEIACRVAATCRRLGIRTVAVYSDADAHAAHVAACDEAVCIGPAPTAQSYLVAERILQAARATGAQAVHPGYGFLSENAEFAEACAAAGLVFIGPPPAAMRSMGLKAESKGLMQKAGVPLVPGYHGADQDADRLHAEADAIGYPVLIKASAGGGGKGMREVLASEEFDAALASCRREAQASFGNDAVLIEKLVSHPRHIEIQVFADRYGHTISLFERDCSMQRRHQKVIEEAPAPGLPEKMRRDMGMAAVAAARAVSYVGAGTVEFIVECNADAVPQKFYFMEMNTRLQVEHPVTEMVTGQDLVEWQLRVAAGETLPLGQPEVQGSGHAVEVRLYAENPQAGFLPAIGTLQRLALPAHVAFEVGAAAGEPAPLRIDSGVREGDAITPHYDPMIAKIIAWGENRDHALARMRQALGQIRAAGVQTNVAFLQRLIADPDFASGAVDTGLIARRLDHLLATPAIALHMACAAVVAATLHRAQSHRGDDPWSAADGYTNGAAQQRELRMESPWGELACTVLYPAGAQPLRLRAPGMAAAQPLHVHAVESGPQEIALDLTLGDQRWRGHVVRTAPLELMVFGGGEQVTLRLHDAAAEAADHHAGGGRLTAPMPGKVLAVQVKAGDAVKAGQTLLVLEAMKMEHAILAPGDGTVAEVLYADGDLVAEGAELLRLEEAEEGTAAAAEAEA